MKLEALDHPKTLDLASRLNVELPTAIGYLELLWAFTSKKAPQGDIGKWPDGAIARACFWNKDATVFVTALASAGFIDRHPEHRFVIHDWQDHAPRWVLSKLSRSKVSIYDCSGDYSPNDSGGDSDDSSGDSVREGKGREDKGSQAKADARGRARGRGERSGSEATTKGKTADTPKRRTPKKPEIPLPDDFALDEDLTQYAIDHLADVDPKALFEKFRLQAENKQWRYADWRLAFMGYVRNAQPTSGHFAAGQYPRKHVNGSNGSKRYPSADEVERDEIARGIAEGRTDEDIASDYRGAVSLDRIRQVRAELSHAQH